MKIFTLSGKNHFQKNILEEYNDLNLSKECELNNLRFLSGYFHPYFSLYFLEKINIYSGNKAKTEHKISLSKTATYLIRIPNLDNGIYFIQLFDNKGHPLIVKKLIKIK